MPAVYDKLFSYSLLIIYTSYKVLEIHVSYKALEISYKALNKDILSGFR